MGVRNQVSRPAAPEAVAESVGSITLQLRLTRSAFEARCAQSHVMTPDQISNVQLTLWGMIGEIPGDNETALLRVEAMLALFSGEDFSPPVRDTATEARESFRVWFSSRRWKTKGQDEASARAAVYADVWKFTDALRQFSSEG